MNIHQLGQSKWKGSAMMPKGRSKSLETGYESSGWKGSCGIRSSGIRKWTAFMVDATTSAKFVPSADFLLFCLLIRCVCLRALGIWPVGPPGLPAALIFLHCE